ncbi:AAA family ATPase [Pseudonocardia tropica]
MFVGIDGRSGAGKSTVAARVSQAFVEPGDATGRVTVIEGDDFYSGGSADTWDRRTASEKAALVIDWRRQRDVLERLRRDGVAAWQSFDWDAEDWDSDSVPLVATPTIARPAAIVLLEGAYSCRPELHDLLDLRVLLDVPHAIRRKRLIDREGDAYRSDWDARWSAAEDYYFDIVMSPERFDFVLSDWHIGE